MENFTTVAILLDTRFKRKEDERHPLKLRVTHKRTQKYYSLSKWYSPEEYKQMRFPETRTKQDKEKDNEWLTPQLKKQLKTDSIWVNAKLAEANKILSTSPSISIKDIEAKMFRNEGSSDSFIEMQNIANKLRTEGRIKYAVSFESTITSINKETGLDKLPFSRIDVDFLKTYEKKMIESGHSYTAIGFYIRNLRVAYNLAILKKLIDRESYPFGKSSHGKYEIPTGKNIKKALIKEDIKKLMEIPLPANSNIARGRDYWVFCYLCNGINIKDMMSLRYANIGQNTITFIRSKTARTTRKNPKTIVVPYTDKIKEIVERWGNKPQSSKEYIFPVLTKELTPEQIVVKVASAVDFINNNIQAVAKLAGVNKKITTYTARHSWATVLKRAGISMEHISEGLGHSNVSTTESYLDSFESDDLFKNAAFLTDF